MKPSAYQISVSYRIRLFVSMCVYRVEPDSDIDLQHYVVKAWKPVVAEGCHAIPLCSHRIEAHQTTAKNCRDKRTKIESTWSKLRMARVRLVIAPKACLLPGSGSSTKVSSMYRCLAIVDEGTNPSTLMEGGSVGSLSESSSTVFTGM